MNFGSANEALKEGKRVQRKNAWTPQQFVFMQVPSTIGKDIVPKMQSLPQSVKDHFERTFTDPGYGPLESISYSNQLAMVKEGNQISGYTPSPEDVLAEDWHILDQE